MAGGPHSNLNLDFLAHAAICGTVAAPGFLIFAWLHITESEPAPQLWIFGATLVAILWIYFSLRTYPL